MGKKSQLGIRQFNVGLANRLGCGCEATHPRVGIKFLVTITVKKFTRPQNESA